MLPTLRIATRLPLSSSLPPTTTISAAFRLSSASPFSVARRPARFAPLIMSVPASSYAAKGDKGPAPARPSSSVVLLSPTNDVLLLQRVKTSTSFASAHVFPGGNVDPFHDGEAPGLDDPRRHVDSEVYRLCAIRETFEETGILLAKKDGRLIDVPQEEREVARKNIHASKIKFGDWVKSLGAEPDTAGLLPFTRWITPLPMPKRFTTQMYLYMLPLTKGTSVPSKMLIPTPDGGVEHTEAVFAPPQEFLKKSLAKEMVIFPPQVYLMDIVAKFTGGEMGSLEEESRRFMMQRRKLTSFLKRVPTATTEKGKAHPTANIAWADKVMSPVHMAVSKKDKRVMLDLTKPGLELEGTDRGGDYERVVMVNFGKGGPTNVEVRLREEVLEELRKEEEQSKL